MGEARKNALRVNLGVPGLKLEFHGVKVTNDVERLCVDPAMRQVVGERAKNKTAGSVSQMGRFETEILTRTAPITKIIDCSR